jgi:hypothetical protein
MPKSRFGELFGYASLRRKAPDLSGADLSFVRHLPRRLTHNFLTMNRLPLCLKKPGFSGLVRHPRLGNPHSLSHTHNLQPTSRTVPPRCIIGIITAHLPAKCL